MSLFLQFNNLIENETAREAMESYVGFLKKAFEQYRDLWEDYIKLQEKHKQCNVSSPFQITITEPCIDTKDELTVKSQLNSNIIVQESDDSSLLKLNSSHINTQNLFEDDMETDLANLSEDFLDDSQPKSPTFSKTYPKTNNTFAKMLMRSPKATLVCSKSTTNTEMFHNKNIPSQCKQKLEISTTYHVETTFLPDGKKLKQSRLMFPVKYDKKKIPLLDELKPAGTMQKAKHNLTDTSDKKELITIEDNATGANETFEDVTEIGSTQDDIYSKSKHRFKLKRKVPGQTIKNSLDKNKHHSLKSNFATRTATENISFDLCPSSIFTSAQMTDDMSLVKESEIVDALKHNINTNHCLLTHKSSKADVKSIKSIDNQGKGQKVKDNMQNIFQILSDEEETFYLPAEQTANEKDTDDFTLDDIENEPPEKKVLNKLHASLKKKEYMPEQLNMRCKTDRAKLNGWDCWECEEYYKNLSLSKQELQKRKNQCSRHRQRYERPSTPEGFWDPEFPETLSCTYRHNRK